MASIGFQTVDCKNHVFSEGGLVIPGIYDAVKSARTKIVVLTNVMLAPTVCLSAVPVVVSFNPAEPAGELAIMSVSNETSVVVGQIDSADNVTLADTPWIPA